ncbi:4-alpha-glucanotransferase [Thalassotalea fusca]
MNLIEKLAELVGFHPSYSNCFGETVYADKEARQALLQAMGYDLSNEQTIEQHIQQLEQAKWLTALPSVFVAKHELATQDIILSLPDSAPSIITLQLTLEDGHELPISFDKAQATPIAQQTINGVNYQQFTMELRDLPLGYHSLSLVLAKQEFHCHLICAPKDCFSPQEASEHKTWGYAAQLYSLKSANNWGMGDFGDLRSLTQTAAEQGASTIGLNPLHPLYQNNPAHRSPYSPTSRCYLNTMYIDVTAVDNFKRCKKAQAIYNTEQFQQQLASTRTSEHIDYVGVAELKYPVLEALHQDLVTSDKKSSSLLAFETYKQNQGEPLALLATFDALYEYFREQDAYAYGWTAWPQDYQTPDSQAVDDFRQTHAARIDYFMYLQWLAHQQLQNVSELAKQAHMPIGLYLDLAVGCDGSGFDVWSNRDAYVAGAAVGAPPDAMNTLGQDWGLTPINPVQLQKQGYKPLVDALRSNMQYAGALRIDHILGLMRQYWVAPGKAAHEGVYISFPFKDILRVIALESRRNQCVVIGEDLGTVPDGFSEIMAEAGLLSYKVLFFEKWESGLFMRPELYPEQSMVTVSTHDLPTLTGWWNGRDLAWRQQLDLYPNEQMGVDDRNNRVSERENLLAALQDMNTIDMQNAPSTCPAKANKELAIAVQKFLAHANSHLQLVPLEDALCVTEQVNIPGTIDEHPNWLQKLPVALEEFAATDSVASMAAMLNDVRPSQS